jgi:hypothetical protein
VFGDGLDYDWALEGDDIGDGDDIGAAKKDLRLEDVSCAITAPCVVN